MAIYLLTPLASNAARVREAINHHLQSKNVYELQNEAGYLVSYPGTSIELSNELEITGQPKGAPAPWGSVLITSVGSYYGRGPTDMWEWLKTRLEGTS